MSRNLYLCPVPSYDADGVQSNMNNLVFLNEMWYPVLSKTDTNKNFRWLYQGNHGWFKNRFNVDCWVFQSEAPIGTFENSPDTYPNGVDLLDNTTPPPFTDGMAALVDPDDKNFAKELKDLLTKYYRNSNEVLVTTYHQSIITRDAVKLELAKPVEEPIEVNP